jgi:PAS domain S-box-containing protein
MAEQPQSVPHRPSAATGNAIPEDAFDAAARAKPPAGRAQDSEKEHRYRALFASLDEGISLNELVVDGAGRVVDYRIIETNLAFDRITGCADARGRLAREAFPGADPVWLQIYARVAETGDSLKFEVPLAHGKWLSVSASRFGPAGSQCVAAVLNDVTERRRREDEVEFMASVADDFARFSSPDELMAMVGPKYARHLQLRFLDLVELKEGGVEGHAIFHWRYDGVPPNGGLIRLAEEFGGEVCRRASEGVSVVISDVGSESADVALALARQGLRAVLAVPLVREGRWKYLLVGGDSRVRDWRPSEVASLAELGNRVFPRLERAAAEAALRAGEEWSRALISNLPGGAAFVIDRELRFQFADGEALSVTGRRPADFIGKTLVEALTPELARTYRRCCLAALSGKTFSLEHEAAGRSFLARGVPLKNSDGEITGVLALAFDITGRREMEHALAEREEQFRRAIEDAPIPVIMHAEDGQVLCVNRMWTNLTGYRPEEIATFDAWLNKAYGYGADAVREHVEKVFAGLEAPPETGFEIVTRTGERRYWVFSASAPGTLSDGRRYAVGMVVDLTERKRAEEALAASQEQLRLIVESANEYAIVALDLERRIVNWSAGAERMTGIARDEAIGQLGDIVFVPEDRDSGAPAREAALALVNGRAEDERWHLRRDQTRFWASGVMLPMHAQAGGAVIGFVKIFRDETEKRQAREALEASQERLRVALEETERARAEAEGATKAKDHFIAVLSHELRTPLTPVLMAAHAMAKRGDLPEEVRDAFAMTRSNIQLEARLVDDLLDVTRIARGKMEVIREPMDLHAAITKAIEVSQPDLDAREQKLTVDLRAEQHHFQGDSMRLKQVVWNLLKNASKFSPRRGQIFLGTRNEGMQLVMEVTDCGIGIEPEALGRIFESFVQANTSITREFGGLGLGLSIAKASVRAHGGDLRASSPGKGKGATFTVTLPLLPPAEAEGARNRLAASGSVGAS